MPVELDRTLGFYHNPKILRLIAREKKYSTMYMTENGKDVMLLKFMNGRYYPREHRKQKKIEILLTQKLNILEITFWQPPRTNASKKSVIPKESVRFLSFIVFSNANNQASKTLF